MKITRNQNGAIKVDGKSIDMYDFTYFLISNDLGPPSKANRETIESYLTGQEAAQHSVQRTR